MKYSFRNVVIRSQILKSTKVVWCILTLSLTISEILTFKIDDLQKVGHDHGVVFTMLLFDGKYQNLQKTSHAILRYF